MHVVVVGAGASGMLVATRLLAASDGVRVTLVDRNPADGGTAYRRPDGSLLLNVRANGLSADPASPRDFVEWVRRLDGNVADGAFLPRRLYGDYLRWVLAGQADDRLERISGEVGTVAALGAAGGEVVVLDDGRRLEADAVVLALGNPPPAPLPGSVSADYQVIDDALDPDALALIDPDDPVTVVGSGLTAVDVVLALTERGHRGTITVLGPSGRLPLPHCEHGCTPVDTESLAALADAEHASVEEVFAALRAHVRSVVAQGSCWRSAIDGLRPYTNRLWAHFDDADRRRFMRRYRPFFERHRHRIAPAVDAALAAQLDAGRLQVVRGRMTGITSDASGSVVVTADGRRLPGARWVLNATGPSLRTSAFGPLVARLVADGRARAGWDGYGLDVDADGRVVAADGRPQATLWTLGPVCRGVRWESTAIPEIRVQAAQVAQALLSDVAEHENV